MVKAGKILQTETEHSLLILAKRHRMGLSQTRFTAIVSLTEGAKSFYRQNLFT